MKKRTYKITLQKYKNGTKKSIFREFTAVECEDAKKKASGYFYSEFKELHNPKTCACSKPATHKRPNVKSAPQPWECKQCYDKGIEQCVKKLK